MQAASPFTPRLAEEAIHARVTCLPIESLPLSQCVGGTLRGVKRSIRLAGYLQKAIRRAKPSIAPAPKWRST